eukprot:scaffold9308_cov72-Phaeocystis_antarctica.AAC.1
MSQKNATIITWGFLVAHRERRDTDRDEHAEQRDSQTSSPATEILRKAESRNPYNCRVLTQRQMLDVRTPPRPSSAACPWAAAGCPAAPPPPHTASSPPPDWAATRAGTCSPKGQ